MTIMIDGFAFDVPPDASQVVALAQFHRQQLDEAVFHNEIHLGNYCLAQRKRVYDFTSSLAPEQREAFYQTYDGELRRIADDEDLHPADAEGGVSAFAVVIVLLIIAVVLYSAVLKLI